jgi:hypothetical protein
MLTYTTSLAVLGVLLSLAIIFVLWKQRHRVFGNGELTPEQYTDMTNRLNHVEETVQELNTQTVARLDAFESHLQRRNIEERDFRKEWLQIGEKQLSRMRSIESMFERFIRQLDFMMTKIREARCVIEADEACALKELQDRLTADLVEEEKKKKKNEP